MADFDENGDEAGEYTLNSSDYNKDLTRLSDKGQFKIDAQNKFQDTYGTSGSQSVADQLLLKQAGQAGATTPTAQTSRINLPGVGDATATAGVGTKVGQAVGYNSVNANAANVGTAVQDPAALQQRINVGSAPVAGKTNISGTPNTVANATVGNVANVANTQLAPASQMNAAQAGAANTINAPNLNPAETFDAAGVGGTTVNRSEDQQLRNIQLGLANQLSGQAAGTSGPSVAEALLRKGMNNSINAARAESLGSGAEGNTAAGRRNLINETADANQNLAGQTASLRAQEQQKAQEQLAGVVQGARGQDINVNQSQAQIEAQQKAQESAQLQEQRKQFADSKNSLNVSQAELELRAQQGNQEAINEINRQNAELRQQANINNLNAANQFKVQNGLLTQEQQLQNQRLEQERSVLNAQLKQQANSQIAEIKANAAIIQSQLDQEVELDNAQAQLDIQKFKGSIDAQQAAANQAAINEQRKQNAQFKQESLMQLAQNQQQANLQNAQFGTQAAKDYAAAQNDRTKTQAEIDAARRLADQEAQTKISQMNLDANTQQAIAKMNSDERIGIANLNARLEDQKMDILERQAAIDAYVQQANYIKGQQIQGEQFNINTIINQEALKQGRDIAANQASNQFTGALINAGAAGLAALSDERTKKDIKKNPFGDPELLKKFLKGSKPSSYKYKKGFDQPEDEFTGPMANALKNAPYGKSIVKTDEDGYDRIDTGRLALAQHSVIAALADRLEELEKKKGKGKKK